MVHLLRLLLVLAASPVLAPAPASAVEVAAGFGTVEQGDDRLRPTAALHVGWPGFYQSDAYYYGRTFGPVKEETMILTFARNWAILKSNFLTAHFGAVLMDEKTSLKFDDAASSEDDKAENNYNAGAVFGVAWSLPKTSGPLFFSASWDSHIFPAGLGGGLFLSSGRKQTISLTGGVQLK